MTKMRISERGQVTIPREIRERYGLLPNTDVEFVVDEAGVHLRPAKGSRRKAVRALYGRKKLGRSTDELMSLLRE
jgi:AbrB family looped-hinge helix DNA binding protein